MIEVTSSVSTLTTSLNVKLRIPCTISRLNSVMDTLVVSLVSSLDIKVVSACLLSDMSITAPDRRVSIALSAVKPTKIPLFKVTISSGDS